MTSAERVRKWFPHERGLIAVSISHCDAQEQVFSCTMTKDGKSFPFKVGLTLGLLHHWVCMTFKPLNSLHFPTEMAPEGWCIVRPGCKCHQQKKTTSRFHVNTKGFSNTHSADGHKHVEPLHNSAAKMRRSTWRLLEIFHPSP